MFSLTKQERLLFSGQLPVISCSELEWSSGSQSALRLMLCLELHCTAKLSNICLRDQRDKQTVRDDGWATDKRREKTSMFPTQSQTMNIIMPGSVSELHGNVGTVSQTNTDSLPIMQKCGVPGRDLY